MLSSPDDLADYRAFRAAPHEGDRLARAQNYLDRHPQGVWADEVQTLFRLEEETWFEAAKRSRAGARDYLVDLPRGPHARAAEALLVLFDQPEGNIETLELLTRARQTAAALDLESAQRKRVGEVILEELSALLDPQTWGARLDDPPASIERALRGGSPRTWGRAALPLREDDLFFSIRSSEGLQERLARLVFRVVRDNERRVTEGRIQGDDLFVRWAEAAQARPLDPTNPQDRAFAAAAVAEMLTGALEGLLPSARCNAIRKHLEILARACNGWSVRVQMGVGATTRDAVSVRGPLLDSARPRGMR